MALVEHLEKLRYFILATKFTSIKSAASSIGISQAGLSKSLSSLESALNVNLFYRSSDGLTLTKEGQALLLVAKEITEKANLIENEIQSLNKEKAPSQLKIGMYDSIAVYMYRDLEKYLQTIYPGIDIELCVESSPQLLELTSAGKLDLSIGVNLHHSQSNGSEFFFFFEDFYSIYSNTEEKKQTIVYHPDAQDSDGFSLEKYLKKINGHYPTHKVFNMETVKLLVAQGLGMGILPMNVARPLLLNNTFAQLSIDGLPKQFGKHTIGLLATAKLVQKNREFVLDLVRLAKAWALK